MNNIIIGSGSSRSSNGNEKACEDDDGEEEVVRCVCNIYRDEGQMIQCERCHVRATRILLLVSL